MARFTIYSKEGNSIRHSGEPKYNGTYLNVPYVEFRSIESPTLINWEVGDFVDYYRTGFRYKLYSLPEPKKQARANSYGAAFVYSNVKFYEATKDLEIALFRDLVPEDNKIHFSTRPDVTTFENVYGIAERIQECMDDLFPGKWRIEVYSTDDGDLKALFEEAKEFSVSNGSCLDALSQIYETWKNVGWVHTYDASSDVDVITIGATSVRTESNTTDAFSYGMGNGLTSIKKAAANEGEFATRLYVYGSERNIQTRYYNNFNIVDKDSVNIVNLMIPIDKWGKTNGIPDARKAYLQADDAVIAKYGLIPRIVYFDGSENEEIYPSIQGLTCREVRKAMIEAGQGGSAYLPADIDDGIDVVANHSGLSDAGDKESIEKDRTFRMDVNQVGFDIAEQGKLTSEGYATIAMKSGKCEGREFKVKKSFLSSEGQSLTLERAWDESLGMGFPNTIYPIEIGDKFVLLDIPMPDYYISLASKRLYDAGERLLEDYTRVSAFYEPGINPIKIKEGGKIIRQGMYMRIYDEDIIETSDHTDYVLIDTLTIDEASEIPLYSATLREQKRSARTFGTLEEMIEDAKESAKNDIRRERAYTERRFRSAQETAELLQNAFENFSAGITPATVQTMQLLLGDESLQFRFTSSRQSLVPVAFPLVYDASTKQITSSKVSLVHLTLGIKTITAIEAKDASNYKSWNISAWNSEILEDAEARYVYVRASKTGTTGTFILSKEHKEMDASDSPYYYFLVAILNSEYSGSRDLVPLYGFTEVLPGQISTDVIRSADGNMIIDLVNAVITAKNGAKIVGEVEFSSGSSGLENLAEWSEKQNQIDKAQADANTAKTNASNAQTIANTANASVQALNTRIDGVDVTIAEINNKLDGVVESFFGPYTPSKTNDPAKFWIDERTKEEHIGDTFTNTSTSGEDAGKSWRWLKQSDGTYDWQLIADSDAAKALALAGQAMDSANMKTTTFLVTPSNYKKNDIWIVGDDVPSGFAFKKGDILVTNSDSASYVANHWSKVINYNDEFQKELDASVSALEKAIEDAETASQNYTEEAKTALQSSIDALNRAKADLEDVYDKTTVDGKVNASEQRAIDASKKYVEAQNKVLDEQIKAWANGVIDDAEQDAIDAANAELEEAKKELDAAIAAVEGLANTAIHNANKAASKADAATTEASSAKEIAEAAKSVSESASELAEEANANASTAIDNASEAVTKANTAQGIASAAQNLANEAKELSQQAKTNAEQAKTNADKAMEDAQTANDTLGAWAGDGISPIEKKGYEEEMVSVYLDYINIRDDADKYGLSEDANYTEFVTAYNAYYADLDGIVKSEAEIVPAPEDFSIHLGLYYASRANLLQAISTKAKEVAEDAQKAADDAQKTADDANDLATEAKEFAVIAKQAADDANKLISAVDGDTVLTGLEKQSLRESISRITSITDSTKLLGQVKRQVGKYEISNVLGTIGSKVVKSGDTNNGYSQDAYVGWNALNGIGTSKTNATRVVFSLDKPADVTIEYQSNAESGYDYLVLGALDVALDLTKVGTYTSENKDITKPSSTAGNQDKVLSKTFPLTAGTHFIDVCYRKDNSRDTNTDAGYFRVKSDEYGKVDGYVTRALGKGSFPTFYNKLADDGNEEQAGILHGCLVDLLDILENNDVWKEGNTTVFAEFRSELKNYVAKYCGYEAETVKNLASDWEYLKTAFSKGTTNVSGGVVMTNMVAVKDADEEEVEAFLNGSDFGHDEEHKKLILAAGIPEGADALDERARNARTRLYEDGFFKTIKAEFEQSKVLGSSRSPFVEGAVLIDGEIEDNHYNFDESAGYGIDLPSDIGQSGRVMTYVGTFYFFCTDSYIYDRGKVYGGSTPMYTGHLSDYKAHELVSLMAVTVSEDKVAWIVTNRRPWGKSDYCDVKHHGMVAGFRPKCVVLNDGETYNCTSYDHTLISNSAGTYTNVIVLPSNPQDGQEIKIWKNNDHLLTVKTSDGRKITRLNKLESTVHGIEKLFMGTLDLVYHSSIGGWLMIIHETY